MTTARVRFDSKVETSTGPIISLKTAYLVTPRVSFILRRNSDPNHTTGEYTQPIPGDPNSIAILTASLSHVAWDSVDKFGKNNVFWASWSDEVIINTMTFNGSTT